MQNSAAPVEDLNLHDILLAWCAIHFEGRLPIGIALPHHFGTIDSWAEWSSSNWVAARKRSIQARGVPCFEAHFHCSFPPGVRPRTERDRAIIQNYGRWISTTEWAPPPDWSDDVKAGMARAWSLTSEAMSTHQVLVAWRAIHAEGRLPIDATRYVPGSVPFWSKWSGSAWVARLEQKCRGAQTRTSVLSDFGLHLALPPRWDAQLEDEKAKIRKYGRWITETEWEPPAGTS